MIEVIEMIASRRNVLARLDTFEAAKAKVESMGIAHMEDDSDYPNCADALLRDGRIIAIQPEGFTLDHANAKASALYQSATDMAKERAAALAALDAEFFN